MDMKVNECLERKQPMVKKVFYINAIVFTFSDRSKSKEVLNMMKT